MILAIVLFVAALAILILVHEAGHFFVAKLFGIRVDEFAIGFPPRLAAVRKGETEYSINLILFGGFVRIFGEQAGEGERDPRSFSAQSRWVQAAVAVAGILMNFILAWLLICIVYLVGVPTAVDAQNAGQVQNPKVTIIDTIPGSPAANVGLQPGDVLLALGTGTNAFASSTSSQEATAFIEAHASQSILLEISRNGTDKVFLAMPQAGFLQGDPARKILGVELADVGIMHYSLAGGAVAGSELMWQETLGTAIGLVTFFKDIFIGQANFSDVAGPVGIAQAGTQAAAMGIADLLLFAAFISINLAFINVLPIPGLDGGRLLFIAIEGIGRREISARIAARATVFGFALIILLMIVVTYHDVVRLL
ncbi:MAG: site-2 protease family protein [Patescibacteria group bacterium]|nr:site-2 protease family protein [Patescibacteria group bacterium]